MKYHEPVLLKEVVENLNIQSGASYIDATLGDGGHTMEILKLGGKVMGIEINQQALERATKRIIEHNLSKNFVGVLGNFKDIEILAKENNFEQVSGIVFDLGYSSFELEEGGEGLSFLKDEPLDMRLDKSLGVTAEDLVNALDEKSLTKLISEYSDERFAKRFARAIVKARDLKRVQTTKQLADILKAESPSGYEFGRIHPATRTFQALRIVVNNEIDNLKQALPRAARLLLPRGKMIVISFHSLEDRVAKNFGRGAQPPLNGISNAEVGIGIKALYKKPIVPTEEEIERNIRSRSSKMRVFEKI